MPLRIIRRADAAGALYIVGTVRPAGTPAGIRVRRRAGTDDARLASEEAINIEAEILRAHHLGERPAAHTLAEAVKSYLVHESRSDGTKALVRRLLRHFGPAVLVTQIGQEQADAAVRALTRPGAAPATVKRNVLVPLAAILKHAALRGWCQPPLLQAPRIPRSRTPCLLPHQVEALIAAAAPHLRPLLTVLVCTGMRLGEALALDWHQVDLRGATARLEADQTKAGKLRLAHLPPAAVAALAGLGHREGRVFRARGRKRLDGTTAPGKPYRETGSKGGGQIKRAWSTACHIAGIQGATPHTLRHTFASWHYALHRNLPQLRDEVGWSTLALLDRYTKTMPTGHEAAIRRVWGLASENAGARAA